MLHLKATSIPLLKASGEGQMTFDVTSKFIYFQQGKLFPRLSSDIQIPLA